MKLAGMPYVRKVFDDKLLAARAVLNQGWVDMLKGIEGKLDSLLARNNS